MNDLVYNTAHAKTGYTCDDEILLVFPSISATSDYPNPVHMYGGNVGKLLTTLASYCSVRFNYYFTELLKTTTVLEKSEDNDDDEFYGDDAQKYQLKKKYFDIKAHFEADIIIFKPDQQNDIINYIIWRSDVNERCNKCTFEEWEQIAPEDVKELMEINKVEWDLMPMYIRYGVFAKRTIRQVEKIDPSTQEKSKTLVSEIFNRSFKMFYDTKFLQILYATWWSDIKDIVYHLFPVDILSLTVPLNSAHIFTDIPNRIRKIHDIFLEKVSYN